MSCGCKVKSSGSSLEMSNLLTNPKTRSEVVHLDYISARDFKNKEKFALLKFAFCADPEAFKTAFGEHIEFPYDFSPSDLKVLAEIWESGDTSQIDVMKQYSTIVLDKEKLATCNIKWV